MLERARARVSSFNLNICRWSHSILRQVDSSEERKANDYHYRLNVVKSWERDMCVCVCVLFDFVLAFVANGKVRLGIEIKM